MSFTDLKAQMRRVVHGSLAASASYIDSTLSAPVAVTARHHTHRAVNGNLEGDYAGVLEGVNRLVFTTSSLPSGLVLRRGGVVTIPGEGVFELDQQEPSDGPENVYWSVAEQ